jgi:hypothetical protein
MRSTQGWQTESVFTVCTKNLLSSTLPLSPGQQSARLPPGMVEISVVGPEGLRALPRMAILGGFTVIAR